MPLKPLGHHWDFPHEMGTRKYFGFIYLVVNRHTGKYYIGRKSYFKVGHKNSRTRGHQNAWRKYKSSSKPLLEDIKNDGIEDFDFYCLAECKSRKDLHYYEVKSIIDSEALLTENSYNKNCPEVWLVPDGLQVRKRRELVKTLISRSLTNGKEERANK